MGLLIWNINFESGDAAEILSVSSQLRVTEINPYIKFIKCTRSMIKLPTTIENKIKGLIKSRMLHLLHIIESN